MAKGRIEQEIAIKIVGGEDVTVLNKQINELIKTKAKIIVDADVSDADKKLDEIDKQLAELMGKKAEIEVDAKVNQALAALDDVAAEAKRAELAAESLSTALGPELAGKADLDSIISDFQRMGLSLDDITAHADRLGAKLQEVGQRDIGGNLTTGFQRIDGDMRSVAGSSSVMANAIGNTTQDLFAMGGIAGTAGVALGQMGEYMADAAFSGEQLGTVLRNFGKIAGPVAAITAAIGIFSSVMGSLKAQAQATAERTKAIGDAMADGADDALAFTGVLRENADALRDYTAIANDPLGNFGVQVDELMSKIPLVGGLFKEAGVDIFETAAAAGLSIYDLSQAIEDGGKVGGEFTDKLQAAADAGKITGDQYTALSEIVVKYGDLTLQAAKDLGLFNVDQEELNVLLQEMLKQRKPLDYFTDQWSVLMEDMRDGKIDTKAAADAVNFLVENLGLAPDVIRDIAQAGLDKELEGITAASEKTAEALAAAREKAHEFAQENRDALRQAREDAEAYAIAVGETEQAVADLGDEFGIMSRHSDALSSIFQLGNAPLDVLNAVSDIHAGIEDLAWFITNEGVPDIFDPEDVDAAPFLDKIASLRGPIQTEITNAFAAGGPDAAKEVADTWVQNVYDQLGGAISKEDITTLLGLADLEATIAVALDAASLAAAQASLELLTGLKGETPYTASIQLALLSGDITPEAAQLLINDALRGEGVKIPAGLDTPESAEAVAEAQAFANEHPIKWPGKINPISEHDMKQVLADAQRYVDGKPVKVGFSIDGRMVAADAGTPSMPYPGGIAGERGPEILNHRYLTVGPTYVPPGTHVTSRRQTARIIRHGGLRGFKRYDQGGVVPVVPPVTNVKVNVNLPAGADGADVVRQVKRWARRNGSLG